MMMGVVRLLFLCCVLWVPFAVAHEIRPAYLQIDESAPGTYDLVWKVPSRGNRVLDIQPRFEEGFELRPIGDLTLLEGYVVYRYRVTGDKDLPGTEIGVDGLTSTTVDVLANIELLDGAQHTLLLQPKASKATVPRSPSALGVAASYTTLGVEHILLGIDHLLFLVALMLIVSGWRMVVKTITAFTLAHSITLALVVLGYITLPPKPVEVMIAFSIVLVCVEAIRKHRGETSLAIQWPWLVAFAFGLLHGFGFAGALLDLGLPQGKTALALLFFNVGVELGQLSFIAVILTAAMAIRQSLSVPRRAPVFSSYVIGSVAAFWVIQRLQATFF